MTGPSLSPGARRGRPTIVPGPRRPHETRPRRPCRRSARPLGHACRRRSRGIVLVTLGKDGRLVERTQLERLAGAAGSATDCFLLCQGGLRDESEAAREAARFFARLDGVLAPLRERVAPLRVALHWPSRPLAGEPRIADAWTPTSAHRPGLWPELERRWATCSRWLRHAGTAVLHDLCAAEIARSPEEEAELDALARQLAQADGRRGALPMGPLAALSFRVMRRRAGEVGERFGREWVAPLWRALPRAPRLHLVGHSFGAGLVTSMVLGGARPASLTLLLAAFSAFAFAPSVPGSRRPGFYYPILAERRVGGPIVVLRSAPVAAPGVFQRTLTGPRGGGDRRRAIVAASALAAVGARGVGAPELELRVVQRTGIPQHPIVNVDGSAVMKTAQPVHGARPNITRCDIAHREIVMLVALAAGLLVGGPDGARPAPVDPLLPR